MVRPGILTVEERRRTAVQQKRELRKTLRASVLDRGRNLPDTPAKDPKVEKLEKLKEWRDRKKKMMEEELKTKKPPFRSFIKVRHTGTSPYRANLGIKNKPGPKNSGPKTLFQSYPFFPKEVLSSTFKPNINLPPLPFPGPAERATTATLKANPSFAPKNPPKVNTRLAAKQSSQVKTNTPAKSKPTQKSRETTRKLPSSNERKVASNTNLKVPEPVRKAPVIKTPGPKARIVKVPGSLLRITRSAKNTSQDLTCTSFKGENKENIPSAPINSKIVFAKKITRPKQDQPSTSQSIRQSREKTRKQSEEEEFKSKEDSKVLSADRSKRQEILTNSSTYTIVDIPKENEIKLMEKPTLGNLNLKEMLEAKLSDMEITEQRQIKTRRRSLRKSKMEESTTSFISPSRPSTIFNNESTFSTTKITKRSKENEEKLTETLIASPIPTSEAPEEHFMTPFMNLSLLNRMKSKHEKSGKGDEELLIRKSSRRLKYRFSNIVTDDIK